MTNYIKPHTACDFYKIGHRQMLPISIDSGYNNFTPRSSKLAQKIEGIFDEQVVVFGIQGFIKTFLIDLWNQNFFNQPREKVVQEYRDRVSRGLCLNPDDVDVSHVEQLHTLGYLPISIKALPEGSMSDIKVPVLTIKSTHPDFAWLPNYIESVISSEVWKSINTATIAWQYRKLLDSYTEQTGAAKEFTVWQGHDFSFRGQSGLSDAATSCAGHLLSFLGTDTIPAMDYLDEFYHGKKTFVGGSVPASEHFVASANIILIENSLDELGGWGGKTIAKWMAEINENLGEVYDFHLDEVFDTGLIAEYIFAKRLITEVFPSGIVSYVSDTYDYWSVITKVVPALKPYIKERPANAVGLSKLVVRPDSGDPVDIICGTAEVINLDDAESLEYAKEWACEILEESVYSKTAFAEKGEDSAKGFFQYKDTIYEAVVEIEWNRHDKTYYFIDGCELVSFKPIELTAEEKGSIETLWELFGGAVNTAGYKELDSHIGLIYGDSITLERAQTILQRLKDKGFASSNVVFGIGSFTYNFNTRDSFGFAMKATSVSVDGKRYDVYKDPKTGDGLKKSAKGLLRVEKENGRFVLYDQQTPEQEAQGELKEVFRNGELLIHHTLEEIRTRLHG